MTSFVDQIAAIAGDFHPSNDGEYKLALQEMREALHTAIAAEQETAMEALINLDEPDDVNDKTNPRFQAGYMAGLNDARLEGRTTQVVGRIHHNFHHEETVRAVLNSVGLSLADNAPLYSNADVA